MTTGHRFLKSGRLLPSNSVVASIRRWVFVVVFLMSAPRSFAQARNVDTGRNFDIEHLQLAVGGGEFVATESASPAPPWTWRLGLAYRYSSSPLVVSDGVTTTRVIASRSLVDLTGNVEIC